ncbi:AMP-forming long-chain acyl-CoA synthetase [Burkholderia sp. Ch1-1]|uniref:AMP-binding protein n=1 Tax=Paraburkholderia sp. USG1 TaxID=2952268 RepID=UPI0001D23660|nr:AMP-binding protein [Paraburkholderia sp. USG1]EIF35119.1 AMP-forming long-chain acyl-CoA synthetase [Burkholderia sp. Ch1-1]MDR8396325.1 AMP-binding protein [Paraburkholderia sp. USG1]
MANPQPSTLPDWLRHQAQHRPHAVALRHKRLGAWHALSWHEVATAVEQLAAGLAQRGFAAGDALLFVSHPREEALLLSLAAQWNGGVAIPLDPHLSDEALRAVLTHLAPRFVFAEDDTQVDRLLAHEGLRVIDANPRNLTPHPHPAVTDYRTLAIPHEGGFASVAQPHDDAFAFVRLDADRQLVAQRLSHATLAQEAQRLVGTEKLGADDEAFAARAFAAASQARYLIAPWLLSGFRLNFPESLATRDNDRRELAPTLVAGTRETYARVAQLVDDRLPGARSWRRRLINRAQRRQGGPLLRVLTWWFISRPLREVIGFSRTHAALVIGPPLDGTTAALFAALRVDVRAWPDTGEWRRIEHRREAPAHQRHAADGAAEQPAY